MQFRGIFKRFLTRIYCEIIAMLRWCWYFIRKRSPEVIQFKISDRVLINDRVLRLSYVSLSTTKVIVEGIDRYHQLSNRITFEVPQHMNFIEVRFCGVRETIVIRKSLTFIKVNIDHSHFQKTLQQRPQLSLRRGVILHEKTFAPDSLRPVHMPKANMTRIKSNLKLYISYPEIDKSNQS